MKGDKIEKQILYIINFILISVVLILIFSLLLKELDFAFSQKILNPLATFSGALIGAGLSGGIAIYVMHRDINSREQEKTSEKNDNFEKSYLLIYMWSGAYLESVERMYNIIQFQMVDINALKQEVVGVELCKIKFDSINDDYIPKSVYKEFLDIKVSIDFIISQYKAFIFSVEKSPGDKEEVYLKKWIVSTHEDNAQKVNNNLYVLSDLKDNLI